MVLPPTELHPDFRLIYLSALCQTVNCLYPTSRIFPLCTYDLCSRALLQLLVCEFFAAWAGVVGDDLTGPQQLVFVNDKAFKSYRPTGVYLICAYPHLGPKAVAVADPDRVS